MSLIKQSFPIGKIYSPFEEIFNDFFQNGMITNFPFHPSNEIESRITSPSTNIHEDEKNIFVDLMIPGFKKQDVQINLEDRKLTVHCKHSEKDEINTKKLIKKEFHNYEFARSFNLPEDVEIDNISGKYENGILSISIPKIEKQIEDKPSKRLIEIK
jgi:HSP20 family protein